MYLNKAIVIGNLTRDPELKSLPSGVKVCSFSVATNRVWKKDGVKQESADYHNVVVFDRVAENVAQYMKKGSQVMVEGRMQTRSWDDKTSGEKKYRTEIVASSVQFGSKASDGGTYTPKTTTDQGAGPSKKENKEEDSIEYPEEDINPEDIPF